MAIKRVGVSTFLFMALASGVVASDDTPHAQIKLSFNEFLVPIAHVQLNGMPMALLVDTGSQFAFHLTPDQIKKIGADPTSEEQRTTDAAGNIQNNTIFTVKNVDLNGMHVDAPKIVPRQQWGYMLSGIGEPPMDPVIGLGAFAGKVLMLDYKNRLMHITNQVSDAMVAGETFVDYPFELLPEGLLITAEHDGRPYRLIVDSGATASVVWDERLHTSTREDCTIVMSEMDNEGCQAVRLAAISSSGEKDAFTAVAAPGRFDQMASVDGLLGNNFLNNRKFIVDFAKQKLLISMPST